VPGSAFAQATRTWVSGVGDDANPCSRTAPCKTFAGAISKTAAKGEINCLDPGGFGGVTITKSIAIKCHYTEGGVLVSGTNAIVINAASTDQVTLRGLDINGLGTGLNGVRILSAKNVQILDTEIYGFVGAGVDVNPAGSIQVLVKNAHIHNTGIAVLNAPQVGTGFTTTRVRYSDIEDNTCGLSSTSTGQDASTPSPANNCGTISAPGNNKPATISAFHNGISSNGTGVLARGGLGVVELAYSDVTANSTFGLHRIDSGTLRTFTPATNVVSNNFQSDTFNSSVPLQKKKRK
jgi:hypothetical protein